MVYKLINIFSYIYLLISSLIIAGEVGGGAEEEVYVMPAGYAFSIWGIIYLLLLGLFIRQFFANEQEEAFLRKSGWWLAVSMVLSGTAVIVSTTLSILFIAGTLLTLCVLYTKTRKELSISWMLSVPITVYLGWISVATIVDAFVVMEANGITELFGIEQLTWAVLMLSIGGLIALVFYIVHKDVMFPLVFIWGYIAIWIKQDVFLIQLVTGTVIILLVGVITFKNHRIS